MLPGKDGASPCFYFKNMPLALLLHVATGVPDGRVLIHGGAPEAKYSLRLCAPRLDLEQLTPVTEMAIASAAGMKLSQSATEEDAYILQSTAI